MKATFPLTILLVGFPFAPVSPDTVGGAEQILSHLDARLTERGHEVIMVAMEGSRSSGILIPTPVPEGILSEAERREVQQHHYRNILTALRTFRPDIVHVHGLDFLSYLPPPGVPVLATLHMPLSWYPREVFRLTRENTFLQCVSRTQHAGCPPEVMNLLPPVENGIPLDEFDISEERDGVAIVLGRICPEKNFHEALVAAVLAGVPLDLCGKVFPYAAHDRYFRERIAPLLDDRRRFLGPVTLEEKRKLLSRAKCLLLPSRAPESSSLAAMEALASGVPVIAYRSGALPEIIEDGVTGFLVDGPADMAEAIRKVDALDPGACRRAARERFSAARMVSEYEQRYSRILGLAFPPPPPARRGLERSAAGVRNDPGA